MPNGWQRSRAFPVYAMFSSDIGHFDVPDMTEVVPEAYAMVEDGLASAADFRDFTFANVVRLFGRQNPRFFRWQPRRRGG
jgi:hypothetical protein